MTGVAFDVAAQWTAAAIVVVAGIQPGLAALFTFPVIINWLAGVAMGAEGQRLKGNFTDASCSLHSFPAC